jgi:NAD(P)-dependent dehydrogenase (short-subunit alcohol dehydrogenase family)
MTTEQEKGAVLVTGTSSGIGRALALHLDRLGFRVFAAVRSERDAEAWRSQATSRLSTVLLDVTDAGSVARARKDVGRALGDSGLWGLVNNAGMSFRAPLEAVSLERLRALFDVNVFGALAVTQAFLPLLRRCRGRVVNVSSIASVLVTPFHGPYSASKVTLNALSTALRLELAPLGVQVSIMIVGGVQTEIWNKVVRLTEEATGNLSPELEAAYGARQRRALDYFMSRGRSGMSPDAAARAIGRALTDKRAKRTYLVGRDARAYLLLSGLLSGGLRDRFILRRLR